MLTVGLSLVLFILGTWSVYVLNIDQWLVAHDQGNFTDLDQRVYCLVLHCDGKYYLMHGLAAVLRPPPKTTGALLRR